MYCKFNFKLKSSYYQPLMHSLIMMSSLPICPKRGLKSGDYITRMGNKNKAKIYVEIRQSYFSKTFRRPMIYSQYLKKFK